MRRYVFIFLVLLTLGFSSLKAGAQATSGSFKSGSVKIGYDNRACTGTLEGAIRYNSSTPCAEFCDGTNWTCPSSTVTAGCTGPVDCATAGNVCADGSVFAGCAVGNVVYVTRCDFDDTWNGSTCTGTTGNQYWANDSSSTNLVATGVTSETDGQANTIALTNGVVGGTGDSKSTAGLQPHNAAQFCADLSMHGKTDWYLPSIAEAHVMYWHEFLIGNLNSSGRYWTSSENSISDAYYLNFNGGQHIFWSKSNTGPIRCMRRN